MNVYMVDSLINNYDLADLYLNQKLCTREIAAISRFSQSTVCRALQKANILRRPSGEAVAIGKKRKMMNALPKQVLEKLYLEEQMSAKKIAERLGLGHDTVPKYLKEYGIPMRDRSAAGKLTGFRPGVQTGESNPNWKGGRVSTKDGYVLVLAPHHSRAKTRRYILEHILVWEQVHNRVLPEGWVIHHLNGIRTDNRPENLIALPRQGHARRELGELYKKRIRELEAKNKILERALDSQQLIWWSEN